MQEKIEVNEHTENIVRAVTALTPSRNYIVQFLAMLPMDFPTMYDAFPELLRDEKTRKALEIAFGVSFGEKVDIQDTKKLGYILREFFRNIFTALENEEVVQGLAQLTETNEEKIPAPRKEWLELRLHGLAMEPNYGQEAVNVLKTIKKVGEERNKQNPAYEASVTRISKIASVEERRIHYVIDLLLKYKLVEKLNITEEEQGKYSKKEGIRFVDSLKDYAEMIDIALK